MHCCTGECVGKVAVRVLISLGSTEIDYTKLVLAWYPSHRNSESVGPPREHSLLAGTSDLIFPNVATNDDRPGEGSVCCSPIRTG